MKIFQKDHHIIIISILLLIIGLLVPIREVALLITALFFVIAILKPKPALLLLLIYIPSRELLTTYQDALKGIGDAIIFGALIAVAIYYISRGDWRGLLKFRLYEYAFFAFLIIGGISALLTGVEIAAIIFQYRAFLLIYLVYYTVTRLDITFAEVKSFLWITFGIAVIFSIHGIIEKLSLRELLLPQVWQDANLNNRNKERVYGLINNPNHLATLLTFAFVSSLYLRSLMMKSRRWFIDIGLILMAGVFFLADSKGAMLIALMLLVYFIFSKSWRKLILVVSLIVMGYLLVVQPVHYFVYDRPFDGGSGEERRESSLEQPGGSLTEAIRNRERSTESSTSSGRLMIFRNGFEVFFDHPIMGTGFGTFGDSATKSYDSPIYEEYDLEPGFYSDSQYIQIIAQTGVLGVLIFAVFLLGMLYTLWKRRDGNRFVKVTIAFLLAGYVGGAFYNIWEMDIFTLYFFMILGFVMGDRPFTTYYPTNHQQSLGDK